MRFGLFCNEVKSEGNKLIMGSVYFSPNVDISEVLSAFKKLLKLYIVKQREKICILSTVT